ncbi:MAG: cation diffusion facilitator family transporter [Polyangia bacterium]|nr:cation diffusion facilitator family transporter [Polyangia bacterium]
MKDAACHEKGRSDHSRDHGGSLHHENGHSGEPGHHHSHDFRAASRRALWIALWLLLVIFVAELVGGLVSGSLALLADAGHLLTDVAAVGLALLAQWFGKRPACAEKSYGFRRVEILAALVNGLSLWVISGFIIYEAVQRMQRPPEVELSTMVAVGAVGLVVQTLAALVLVRASGESLNVKGAYVHAATDAVQSAGVVITGLVMMATSWWLLDPIVSIAIAALIAWSGGRIAWEATHVLMEGTPSGLDLPALARAMKSVPGVTRVTDLHAWSITTGYNALSAHVVTGPVLSPAEREELRERLATRLREDFQLHHLTLQVEAACTMCDDARCSDWIEESLKEKRT